MLKYSPKLFFFNLSFFIVNGHYVSSCMYYLSKCTYERNLKILLVVELILNKISEEKNFFKFHFLDNFCFVIIEFSIAKKKNQKLENGHINLYNLPLGINELMHLLFKMVLKYHLPMSQELKL